MMPRRRRAKKNPDFSKSKRRRASAKRWRDRSGGGYGLGHERDERRQRRTASRVRRRVAARRAKSNPAEILAGVDWAETGKLVGIAFGAFAASRLTTRIIAVQVAKRKPTWAKHVGVLASGLEFAAALLFAKRWKRTADMEVPLIVGTGLALLQTAVQTYFPKLGWIVSDASPEEIAQAANPQLAAPQPAGLLPDDDGDVDDEDGDWSDYNDAYDQGRFARSAQPQNQPPPRAAPPAPVAQPTSYDQEGGGIDDSDIDDVLTEMSQGDGYAPAN